MSSVQIKNRSPRTKSISYHTFFASPSAIRERPSVTLTSSNTMSSPKPTISHIKTQKAIHVNTTPSPQQHKKFIYPTTYNTHSKSSNFKTPQKQNKRHRTQSTHPVKKSQIDMLSLLGYKKQKTLSPSLQGEVFTAFKTARHADSLLVYGYVRQTLPDMEISNIFQICYGYLRHHTVVIKSACKKLHRQRISSTKCRVKEDIVKEAGLMEMFKRHKAPRSIIEYHDFFEDADNYYLVMERGGQGLFEFVVECHRLIGTGKLALKDWKKAVRFIFAKMVSSLNWMHNVAHCCNLDVSLENVVMCKDTYIDQTGKIQNLDIRFIDFGVTERFNQSDTGFMCDKFVGKTSYKAPKVFLKQHFCANKADIWSLAVCLWMMSIGVPLYKMPIARDQVFRILKDGQILVLLQNWSRLNYIGKNQYDLLMKMLNINEEERFAVGDVMKHPWIQSYFRQKPKIIHSKCDTAKRVSRSPSIKESETFEFKHEAYCAAVDVNDNSKLNK